MRTERLRTTREARGYTQEELGDLIGEAKLQIWRWENGKNAPNANALAKLATALNVSSDYLLGLTDSPVAGIVGLSEKEKAVISALRIGDIQEAIRLIVSDE